MLFHEQLTACANSHTRKIFVIAVALGSFDGLMTLFLLRLPFTKVPQKRD